MSAERKPISVVCAVIEDGQGRVLIAQRPPHKHLGLKWEFPGGKIDPGETHQAALIREIQEEFGCAIEVGAPLPQFVHDYGTVRIEMFPFVCTLACESPFPDPREHLAARWLAPEELTGMDLAAADLPVVESYRAHSARNSL